MPHLEVYVDDQGEHRWRRIADNGDNIANGGEGYANRQDCEDMATGQFPDDEVVHLESEA